MGQEGIPMSIAVLFVGAILGAAIIIATIVAAVLLAKPV